MSDAADLLTGEEAPLLPSAQTTTEDATTAAITLSVGPDDELVKLESQLVEAERAKELAKRKAELVHRIAAAEADAAESAPTPGSASIGKAHHSPVPSAMPSSSILPEPEAEPATDDEAQAALKVQAAWRGKAGLKKAAEQEQATRTGSERIVAAKRTIRNRQIAVMLLVMLTTAVGTIAPTFIIGAVYGAVANGDGIDSAIALNIGLRLGTFLSFACYCQIEVFS
jgi:hypothetical protein